MFIIVTNIIKIKTCVKQFFKPGLIFNSLFYKKIFILSKIFFIFVNLFFKVFCSDIYELQVQHYHAS